VYVDNARSTDPQTGVEVRSDMILKLGRHYRQLIIPS
jgi:hypothetical protein